MRYDDKRPVWRRVRVRMPASKGGLRLMSKAGWWVNADGSVSKRRNRLAAYAGKQADAQTLRLAT